MRANQVYQDYISDRHHTHMNATQVSVGLFVDYRKSLGFFVSCLSQMNQYFIVICI